MFDLQVLAYQADLTRVITFMIGRELSGATYPEIGVPDAHHPLSHHQNDPEKIAKLAKINAYHVTAVRVLPREAAVDARRRRLAARSRRRVPYGSGHGDCNAHDPARPPARPGRGGSAAADATSATTAPR